MINIIKRKSKSPKNNSDIEKCVYCGTETEYRKDTPIDERFGYIKGAGQLCRKCYQELYGKESYK